MVQYEPEAVRLLVQMMDPNFVCTVSAPMPRETAAGSQGAQGSFLLPLPTSSFVMQKIRACDSPGEDPLGSDPCAWGPQYWCKNMATAVECQVSVGRGPSPGLPAVLGSPPPRATPPVSLPQAVEHCRRHMWN